MREALSIAARVTLLEESIRAMRVSPLVGHSIATWRRLTPYHELHPGKLGDPIPTTSQALLSMRAGQLDIRPLAILRILTQLG